MPAYKCFLCGDAFAFGDNHVYDGRHIGSWGVEICNRCLGGNPDGIMLERHPLLEEYLKAKGKPIVLNANGYLDIPSS
jgi:hypothetical protein